ncbi:MAG: hypothetical protein KUG67_03425 [Proteobacteria bacterium]|nr:hypothetical protein [Pseudomonadota bacterium]
MRNILVLFFLLTITSCSAEKRIDASNEDNMKKSIAEIMKDLEPDEQERFEKSLMAIMFGGVSNLFDLAALGKSPEVAKGTFYGKVDGKTAHEIITLADSIKSEKQNKPKMHISSKLNTPTIAVQVQENGKEQIKEEMYNQAIQVSLESIETTKGDYKRYIEVKIKFVNLSDRNIKGIKGIASFKDIFGDTIKNISLSSDEGINSKDSYIYRGSISINQFSNADNKLATTAKNKIQFSFKPEIILFEKENTVIVDEYNPREEKTGTAVSAEDFLSNR